jgi:polysaccharide export outer membrane protein
MTSDLPPKLRLLAVVLAGCTAVLPVAADPPPAADGEAAVREYRQTTRIRPGDTLRISVREDPDLRVTGEVSAAGFVVLPYLGEFSIAGRSPAAAETALQSALERQLYERATPSVVILRQAPRYIYVYGAVGAPGRAVIDDTDRLTLVQAITDRKGLTSWGAPDKAYLLRDTDGGRQRIALDIERAFSEIDGSANLTLQHGDTIFVPSAGSVSVLRRSAEPVYVYGAVKLPGRRALPNLGKLSVMQAITEAGGLTNWADGASAFIVRIAPESGKRQKIPVDVGRAFEAVDGAANQTLLPRDMLYVPSTGSGEVSAAQPLEIIITGEVKQPGLIVFEAGEERTLVRAIFKAGGLTEYAKDKAVVLYRQQDGQRLSQTVDVDRIIRGGHMDGNIELRPGDQLFIPERRILGLPGG